MIYPSRKRARGNSSQRKSKLTLDEVKKGSRGILNSLLNNTVDQAEFDRRAAICLKCPFRTQINFCGSCSSGLRLIRWVDSVKKSLGMKKEVTREISTYYCAPCGCGLLPKLQQKIEFYADEDKTRYHPSCWIRENDNA